jgi:hypothetical protein
MKKYLFAFLFAFPLCAFALGGADSVGVPVLVAEKGQGHVTLKFGNAAGATFCIDPQFGESEYPPKAPRGLFDVRFTDHRDVGTSCLGEGVIVDIHPPLTCGVADTFQIDLQASAGGYPMKLSWPNGLGKSYDSLRLTDLYGGKSVNVNMLKASTTSVANPKTTQLWILAKKCVGSKAKHKKAKVKKTG